MRFGTTKDSSEGEMPNLEGLDNEFASFFNALDRFETKYFNYEGDDSSKYETKNIFSEHNSIDRMFKRMRSFENKFYKNYDRFLKLCYEKDASDDNKPQVTKKVEGDEIHAQ